MASGITGYNVSDIETLMTLWNTNGIQVGGLLFSAFNFLSGSGDGCGNVCMQLYVRDL